MIVDELGSLLLLIKQRQSKLEMLRQAREEGNGNTVVSCHHL
jgi:hypothetical protein